MQFPLSPSVGQTYTFGSKTWTWTGSGWKMVSQSMSFRITEVTSSVNYLEAQGNITGSNPVILAGGSDTNVGMNFSSKGTGNIRFFTNSSVTSSTNQVLQLEHLANSVNFIALRGAINGGNVELEAKGTSTNIGVNIITKGSGTFTVNGVPVAGNTGSNAAFIENSNTVSSNYTMPAGRNAVSAGPVTINTGITVTIPDGQTWVIV